MEEEKKETGFVIKDRRHFDESGEVRTEEAKTMPPPAAETGAVPPDTASEAPGRTDAAPASPQDAPGEEQTYPAIDFQNFILSLSTTAMYHFGDFPDPTTGETRRNLSAAKQTIDILGMLRDKTEGNLKDAEKQLLEGLLFELRMRYVKEKRTR
ncbi:MAG: DUF1844 domain-containing protein [Syntrophales bacterium]|jgi:hypothetical protein|nr:DUF1844 domain-containing protein [Syntrophales bacterium]MDD4338717.1 DUF1844 domain-containing protein [Syntrophales bacterium]HOG08550.1 DUF1844 domain-containing protein [Syntrophales bacterium]HOS78361.1 DUF1844 domain-containing protein [Syntrophales bacterium]HPB69889.1 DUF1844 domain-containing protein [Syntrophales bacterium]